MSELYRESTLGLALIASLDELVKERKLTPSLAIQLLRNFDSEICTELLTCRATIKLKGNLKSYNFADEVWKFVIENCTIVTQSKTFRGEKIKIVAVNATSIQ